MDEKMFILVESGDYTGLLLPADMLERLLEIKSVSISVYSNAVTLHNDKPMRFRLVREADIKRDDNE